MAMDQSAQLDLLTALKDTDVSDRIRVATELHYQELIDAEVTVSTPVSLGVAGLGLAASVVPVVPTGS